MLQEMQAEEEVHQRRIAGEYTAERAYDLTYILTRDIEKAEYARAEVWLRNDLQAELARQRQL